LHTDAPEIVYPPKVPDEKKMHIVIMGPPGIGKAPLIKFLNKRHRRFVINLSDVLQWNFEKETPICEKARAHLDERRKDYDDACVEREKRNKKRKKGADEEPPVNRGEFEYMTEDIIVELLQERLAAPDCNAGVIFDNITSCTLFAHEMQGVRAILRALPD
jgi:adenylate kinase family enzyme